MIIAQILMTLAIALVIIAGIAYLLFGPRIRMYLEELKERDRRLLEAQRRAQEREIEEEAARAAARAEVAEMEVRREAPRVWTKEE